jgi:predicted phage terminase large subunit-like protein
MRRRAVESALEQLKRHQHLPMTVETMNQQRMLYAAKRLQAARRAKESLLDFMKFTMPDPNHPDDVLKSRYEETPVARLLCQVMEKVYRREWRRVAVSIGPQMGKSQITSRGGPAWMLGNDPYLNLILGTYNQDFASEFGNDVREIISSPAFSQVFRDDVLRVGGKATDLLITDKGGKAAFVGRGGSGTGKPADIFIVDDPLKDDQEAQSSATREQVWNWFNKVALTRCHDKSSIVIVHTRWHQDDLIGRLCDPEHPERDKKYAGLSKRWQYINLPAVVDDPKLAKALGLTLEPQADPFVVSMFGTAPIASIWPTRKSLSFLAEAKQMDPAAFGALNMGRPSPEDGDYFRAEWLVEYDRHELPDRLTIYGASDHATTVKAKNDPNVIGVVGVDEDGEIWVLPDLVWSRMKTDQTVEELLAKMRDHEPVAWWLEDDNIAQAFGPFLIQRMHEEKVYCVLDGVRPTRDKMARGRSIQGRMQRQNVRFPKFAPWWPAARREMLNFPNAAHDDFVDFLSLIGLGLLKQHAPREKKDETNVIKVGSVDWILKSAARRARTEKIAASAKGW